MRDFIKQSGISLEPNAIETLVAGFNDAWAIMRVADGVTPENKALKREELGRLAINLAAGGGLDREGLMKAALAHFGIVARSP